MTKLTIIKYMAHYLKMLGGRYLYITLLYIIIYYTVHGANLDLAVCSQNQSWEQVHHIFVLIQNLVTLFESLTVVKKTKYTVEDSITKFPKERSSDMLLHVCLQLITKTDPGTTQTAESLTQSQHSAEAA